MNRRMNLQQIRYLSMSFNLGRIISDRMRKKICEKSLIFLGAVLRVPMIPKFFMDNHRTLDANFSSSLNLHAHLHVNDRALQRRGSTKEKELPVIEF